MRYDELEPGDVQIGDGQIWLVVEVTNESNMWMNLGDPKGRIVECCRDRTEIRDHFEVLKCGTKKRS